MPPGPRSDAWQGLLAIALRVVDSLVPDGYGPLAFRLGGGTVLAWRWRHRISNDIDLFIDDAQALGFLTPRLNDTAAGLAGEYQESAHTLKLIRPEGDIDFIVAGPVTREAAEDAIDFGGRAIALEPVAEILAKKLLFRAASFKPRDAFDLAIALERDARSAQLALEATRHVHPLLLQRLDTIASLDDTKLLAEIECTEEGRPHLDGMADRVAQAIENFE